MKDGFLKVAAATPRIRVADCAYNTARVIELMGEAMDAGVSLCVFPEPRASASPTVLIIPPASSSSWEKPWTPVSRCAFSPSWY